MKNEISQKLCVFTLRKYNHTRTFKLKSFILTSNLFFQVGLEVVG